VPVRRALQAVQAGVPWADRAKLSAQAMNADEHAVTGRAQFLMQQIALQREKRRHATITRSASNWED
jgi:hypothetical protein